MKIAIHKQNKGFAPHWISYCEEEKIPYKLVNCYHSGIVDELKDCDALMWHFYHNDYRDMLFANQLLFSLQIAGKKAFPDFNTSWHFDDKVAQKYLLEATEAPIVKSYVFYTKDEAENWINQTSFPKVFKLRGGAGSQNVQLVKNKKQALDLVNRAFGKGFKKFNRAENLKEKFRQYKEDRDSFSYLLKGFGRLFIPTAFEKLSGREKGYVYFQDFIPNNHFDIRVVVVGEKAFAIKRMVRKNDFRASGSGNIIHSKAEIDERCITTAFLVNKKIKSQSIAFDFVFNGEQNPLIVEISYGYDPKGYEKCPGFWDMELIWHPGKINPYGWMVENIINQKG